MAVFPHVRAEARGTSIEGHLANQAATDEHTQAVINGCEGNLRHAFFGALENLVSGRMVVAAGNHFENLFTLAGRAEPTGLEGILEWTREQLVGWLADGFRIISGSVVSTRRVRPAPAPIRQESKLGIPNPSIFAVETKRSKAGS